LNCTRNSTIDVLSNFRLNSGQEQTMQTDLATLTKLVRETTDKSPIAKKVTKVELEPDQDRDGTDYLRVIIRLKDGDAADDAELEKLLEAIERTVAEKDERYPSVRFLDAA